LDLLPGFLGLRLGFRLRLGLVLLHVDLIGIGIDPLGFRLRFSLVLLRLVLGLRLGAGGGLVIIVIIFIVRVIIIIVIVLDDFLLVVVLVVHDLAVEALIDRRSDGSRGGLSV